MSNTAVSIQLMTMRSIILEIMVDGLIPGHRAFQTPSQGSFGLPQADSQHHRWRLAHSRDPGNDRCLVDIWPRSFA